ncbi:hypothetical protein K1719_011731 [Acacia pycnantha]|nr:hypothetical protein K1719_011731 [Acacia pycnantha]
MATIEQDKTVKPDVRNDPVRLDAHPSNNLATSEPIPDSKLEDFESQPDNDLSNSETAKQGLQTSKSSEAPLEKKLAPEGPPNGQPVNSEASPNNGQVNSETKASNGVVSTETQSSIEVIISETPPSGEVVMFETQPNNEATKPQTQPGNDGFISETQTSDNDIVMSEANCITRPNNLFDHPEHLPNNQFTDFHMLDENQMPIPESLHNFETEPLQNDHPTDTKPMLDNNLVHYETGPNNHLTHSETIPNDQLSNSEFLSHDQLANSQMLSHYELANSEAVNDNQLVASQSQYEIINSETHPSYEIIDASAQPYTYEEPTPETQPNKRRKRKSEVWEHFTIVTASPGSRRACCKQCKQTFAYSTGTKVAGTSHLKRHISKGSCSSLLRNQPQNRLTPYTPRGRGSGAGRRILNVVMEPYPDSDSALSHAVAVCLSDWSLEGKIFSITSNQALNGVAPENLRPLLSVKNPLIINGQLVLGNCIARTLSSVAIDLLGVESAQDIVRKIRSSVKYVKTSESHEEKFLELKQQLQVPSERNLFIDDQTQWNTTYQMLVAASELKEVFSCLDTSDPDYKGAPTMQDWKLAETLRAYLKPVYDVANMLTPTTNPPSVITIFQEVWKLQLDFGRAVMSEDPFVSDLTKIMQEKIEKYWRECSLVLAIAVVMDPRLKMKFVEYSFSRVYGDEDTHAYIKIVDDGIHELFHEYEALPLPLTPAYAEEGKGSLRKTEEYPGGTMLSDSGLTDFDAYIMETSNQQMKSELDIYLEESLLPRVQDIDVLGWWRLNRVKYPILSKMAQDILCVAALTVPADSVFDTKSKEMDQYRSSLRPETLEALVCAKDWMQYGM